MERHPGHRLAAEHDGHRGRLSSAPRASDENTSVLHGVDPETHAVSALHHPAIDAHVDPALIGIADNDVVRRADVAAAVTGVPERRGKSL
jgi:hypothetical protein